MTIVIRNERGIALIITLLVVTLLAITVIEFTYSVQVDQHMARNALSGLQASLLARSGINLGEAFLLHDNPNDPVDAFTEDWCPDPSPDGHACRIDETNGQVLLPPNMRLRVQIVDEGGKLNINLVPPQTEPEWTTWHTNPTNAAVVARRDALERLLSSRGADPEIAERLIDFWEERIFHGAGGGAPAPTQGAPTPPLGGGKPPVGGPPADRKEVELARVGFASLDDASAIPGMTPSVIRKLRPVLTALPLTSNQLQKVNINTAPLEVLRAILGDDGGFADDIIAQRSETPYRTIPAIPGPNRTLLGVRSFYFLVRASGVVNPNPITGRGGIGRSAAMWVLRTPRVGQQGGASAVPWILRQLDWQKEGGAVLFQPQGDQEPGTEDLAVPGSQG